MVSAGPPLQFYPAQIPITSSASGHTSHMNMRPGNAQFYPMNHGHNNMMNNQGHPVVTSSQGHPMGINVGNMGMNGHPPVSHHSHHSVGGHMVMSNQSQGMHPQGNPNQGQNGLLSNPNPQMMVGPQGTIAMMGGRGPSQPQVSFLVRFALYFWVPEKALNEY
jgi:hypothetical protein